MDNLEWCEKCSNVVVCSDRRSGMFGQQVWYVKTEGVVCSDRGVACFDRRSSMFRQEVRHPLKEGVVCSDKRCGLF